MNPFEFELNGKVAIVVSGETGTVIGRAQYIHDENGFLVLYKSADGIAVKKWWSASELQHQH